MVAIGDTSNDRAIGVVLFGSEKLPNCPTTTTTAPVACNGGTTTTTTNGSTTTTTNGSTTTTTNGSTTTTSTSTSTTTSTTMAGPQSIVVTAGASTSLTLLVSGNPLTLTCQSFPNNTLPTGISTSAPTVPPIAPIIAVANDTTDHPTGPYELYCPGTPVGNVVLNDASTSGTISPASPTVGQTFNLTGYQTKVTIPINLVQAASAFGSVLAGSATASVDATHATPGTISPGTINFSVPIPSPPTALELDLPTTPMTVGPFTATTTTQTTTTTAPSGGATTTAPPTAADTSTSSGQLAFTGPGKGTIAMGIVGAALVLLGFALLVLVDAPRRSLAWVTVTGRRSLHDGFGSWTSSFGRRSDDTGNSIGGIGLPPAPPQTVSGLRRLTANATSWILGR